MKYRVYVPVVGYSVYTIDADNGEDAIERVATGEFDLYEPADFEENTDTGLWDVEPESN